MRRTASSAKLSSIPFEWEAKAIPAQKVERLLSQKRFYVQDKSESMLNQSTFRTVKIAYLDVTPQSQFPFFYILCTKYLYVSTNFINVAIWLTVNIITIDDFKMGQTNNDHQVSIQGIDFYYKFGVSHCNTFLFLNLTFLGFSWLQN